MFEAEVHGEFRIQNHAFDKSIFSRVCAMESFTRSCAETLNEPTERVSSEPQSIARLVFTLELSLSKLFIRSRSTTCLLIMRSCSSAKTSKRKTTWRWGFFHRPGSCGFSPSQVSNPLVFKNQLLENQARPLQCSSGLYSGWAISQSLSNVFPLHICTFSWKSTYVSPCQKYVNLASSLHINIPAAATLFELLSPNLYFFFLNE